jgi:hypothetical protein
MQTETDVQNMSRLAIQAAGGIAWRNNVGALKDERGIPVRFGLANDSKRFNEVFKTGDLVGIYQGLFVMWECKEPGWKWSGTKREVAQRNAIVFVRERGGRAGFVTDPAEAVAIMRGHSLGAPHG